MLSDREGRLVPDGRAVSVHTSTESLTGFSHIPSVRTFPASDEIHDALGVAGVVAPDVVSGLIPCDCRLRAEGGAC